MEGSGGVEPMGAVAEPARLSCVQWGAPRGARMPRSKRPRSPHKHGDGKPIEQYEHKGKQRANNPPLGLVKPENDPDTGKRCYAYDPHLDPHLVWTGKAEHAR